MPKFEKPQHLRDALSEPIEFELAGRELKIQHVPPEVMNLIGRDMEKMDGKQTLEFMDKVFGLIIGQDVYKQMRKDGLDLREMNAVFAWLQDQIWNASASLSEPEKNSEETPGESPGSSDGTPSPS